MDRGWQPIESAPIDGTIVDLFDAASKTRIPDCRFFEGEWRYWTEFGDWEYNPHFAPIKAYNPSAEITHWIQVPPPPDQG